MKEGAKTFINNTGQDITVSLILREGGNPNDDGGIKKIQLLKGANELVTYGAEPGPSGYAFLNGLGIEVTVGDDIVGASKQVAVRGSAWDNTLNTNDTITINAVTPGSMDVDGSNS